jgi:hypothetical protein
MFRPYAHKREILIRFLVSSFLAVFGPLAVRVQACSILVSAGIIMQSFVRRPGKSSLLRSLKQGCAIATLSSLTACNSGPARVTGPDFDASAAGSMAMEEYDTNGDGIVNGAELDKAPGLKAALGRLDTNGDQGVSADEVTARVNAWQEARIGLASVRVHITLDGKPLGGAKVVYEPEKFLGEDIKTAYGESNQFGDASISIPREDRPDPNLPGGVNFGLYKVRISRPNGSQESLPARYNTETTIGQEVSYDDPGLANNNIKYSLKSN